MEYLINNLTNEQIKAIVGVNDVNLQLLEDLYGCGIVYRDNSFKLLSDEKEICDKFSRHMDAIVRYARKAEPDYDFIKQSYFSIENDEEEDYQDEIIIYSHNGKPLKPKTYHQAMMMKEIRNNDLLFCIGPAGTGKTFLSVLLAVSYLKKGIVDKIIITRPAVEAGESLGFLPGDLKEKIDPYLMPIYDSLDLVLSFEQKEKLMEKGIIEVMPLAYMRGRTLDKAFIILDEAQNTSDKQMLMFLTRLGFDSKMIVNGDITQIDLNISKSRSGLICAKEKLRNVKNISFIEFDNSDVVRNPLVQTIIERFQI